MCSKMRFFSGHSASKLKKFEDIPHLLSLPLVGTLYQYLPVIGEFSPSVVIDVEKTLRILKNIMGSIKFNVFGKISWV